MGNGYYSSVQTTAFVNNTYGVNNVSALRGWTAHEVYRENKLNKLLNPKNVIRECCDGEDHPNSLPIILALDVTGSMGPACVTCASKLDEIMATLYKTNKDVEFCMMGIGDFECDDAPLQVIQFESDVRILEQTTKIWFEGGGGGNGSESYTAAWYFALNRCKLDCWNRGQKGIIITLGDEPLNSRLNSNQLKEVLGGEISKDNILTEQLYNEVIEKYDVYHIAITDGDSCYDWYKDRIEDTWRPLLGDHLLIASSTQLPDLIAGIVNGHFSNTACTQINDSNEGISW